MSFYCASGSKEINSFFAFFVTEFDGDLLKFLFDFEINEYPLLFVVNWKWVWRLKGRTFCLVIFGLYYLFLRPNLAPFYFDFLCLAFNWSMNFSRPWHKFDTSVLGFDVEFIIYFFQKL